MDDIAVEVGATVVISSGNCTLTSKDGYDDEMTTFTIVVRLFSYALHTGWCLDSKLELLEMIE